LIYLLNLSAPGEINDAPSMAHHPAGVLLHKTSKIAILQFFHSALPCASPFGQLCYAKLCKSAILPICQTPDRLVRSTRI
jgi:hypothetical protein